MKRYIRYILFALLPFFAACEHEIAYNGEYQDPKLVLDVTLHEGDTTISGSITHSEFFLNASYYPENRWLTGVTLSVQRDNGDVTSYTDSGMRLQDQTFSIPLTTPLQVGEQVRIIASHPDYPTAEGRDTIVAKPQVTISKCVLDSVKSKCYITLCFGNNLSEESLLGISGELWYRTKTDMMRYSTVINSNDQRFAVLGNLFTTDNGFSTRYSLFCLASDMQGKEVELEMPISQHEINVSYLSMHITHYSTHAYQYRKSLYAYLGLNGVDEMDLGALISDMFGLEEAVQIYSNIENGIGIVNACSSTDILIYNFSMDKNE